MECYYIEAQAYELLVSEVGKLTAEVKELRAKYRPSTNE
jgi:hypothetical protein